jgi:hypothetical protein
MFSQRINFWRSRICWNHGSAKSHGSFKVEAVLRVYDANDYVEELFALGAGVIAGNVYAPSQLIKKPAYLFQIAASNERHVIFRTYTRAKTLSWKALLGGDEGDSYGENQLFESLTVDLKCEEAKRVETSEGIESHYLLHADFSCLIMIPFGANRRLELEFPVKHFNHHPISKAFQVETGPILFVKSGCLSAEKLDLFKELIPSFIHFNSFGCADFTLDFPYGARGSSKRSKMVIEEVDCDIQLWVADSPHALKDDK